MYISQMIKELSEKLIDDGDCSIELKEEEVFYKVWVSYTQKKPGHYETGELLKEIPEKLPRNKRALEYVVIQNYHYLDLDNIFNFKKEY